MSVKMYVNYPAKSAPQADGQESSVHPMVVHAIRYYRFGTARL